ncbi:MAG: helix-turn-helix transcriptional regulator [Lachnospiraceae bacterium]|nr:helix-turn-helix transcriptional regulator [Lachnospiraceae bacterium]
MEGFTTEEKIVLFREMISCCHMLILADYDPLLHRIGSSTDEETTANELFSLSRSGLPLESFLAADRTPVLFTNRVNMMWLCCPEGSEHELLCVHVLGPFFMDDYSSFVIDSGLSNAGASPTLRQSAAKLVRKLPILSWARVQEYALMLHYLITGEKIRQSALRFFGRGELSPVNGKEIPVTDTHGTYLAEQEMLRMVREGDLELVRHIDRMAVTGTMGQLAQAGDALRQMKNAVLVSVTLFSRAAIEGGLSPETAYKLCDRYFQNVEAAKSLSELTGVASTMNRDFVERVHAVRTQKLSREIEAACSYIERHLEEELSISSLASYAGYMEYYFSKKFKRELGLTPAEYIRKKRLAKAALLLRSTDLDAQQIASRLQFCSQSYFTDCFRKEFGVSPTKYRKEGKA